jgi:hypothetical protein
VRQQLVPFASDLWIADGPAVSFFGFPYPTRASVVRLADGTLWVCSPVARSEALEREITSLGDVRHLVSPNKLHHLFLAEWKQRWPEARLYASPGLARRRPDLDFDAELSDAPDPAWAGQIDQVVFRGSPVLQEVVFFHRASRTAIVTDLVQRFDPASVRGWRGWLMRLDGLVGPEGSTPREWRLSFFDRRAARRAKATLSSWDPQRVVVAHGACVQEHGRAVLERALHWLR